MKLFKKQTALFWALFLLLLSACGTTSANLAEIPFVPYDKIQGAPILHTFGWSFNEIAGNMADIAAAGFGAVQTSPISECITTHPYGGGVGMRISGTGGAWWYHYQPVSFRIGNYQLGTEEEFANMCRIAREHGVKVIVDIVANHFTGAEVSSQIKDEVRNIPGGAYREQNITDGDGRFRTTQSRLLSLLDTNTQNPYVQQEYLKYLKRCVELGASGFRFDAALHIELPEDDRSYASNFWPVVLNNGSEFQYGEILSRVEAERYIPYMPVTDSAYGSSIVNSIRAGHLDAEFLKNYRVRAPAEKLVTWVESHDTYFNNHDTADLTEKQIIYGWALLSARNGSTPLYFNRPAWSSSSNVWGNDAIGRMGNNAWKSREIAALNNFKRASEGKDELITNPAGSSRLMMIQRGDSAAVLINMGSRVTLNNVKTNLSDGVYTDLISGNEFKVTEGAMTGTINARSVVVFY